MPARLATLVRTGRRAARSAAPLAALYRLARELAPDGFTAEQTTELAAVRARIPARLALRLRVEVACCPATYAPASCRCGSSPSRPAAR